MFIVSEELLERLICCQCKKYLSAKPVKVYPNRGIKCGRCSITGDAGVVSLFGVLAKEALFRCVNRFEGCNQLLSYSDVAEHEKSCKYKIYDCPCCIETFKGNAYEIYNHFKEKHFEQALINTSVFVLEIDNELVKSYLHRKNDFLFYVNATYNKGDEEVILNVMYLGTAHDASKMTQMFTLHSLDGELKYKTKKKSCCPVTGGSLKGFKININPADFSKNIVVCKLDLNTENVDYLLVLPEDVKKVKSLFSWSGSNRFRKLPDFDLKPGFLFQPEKEGFMPTTDVSGDSPRILFFNELIGRYPDKKSIPPAVPFPFKPAPKPSASLYGRPAPFPYFLHSAGSTTTTSAPITTFATGVNSFNQPITVAFQVSNPSSTTSTWTFGTSNLADPGIGKPIKDFSSALHQHFKTTVPSTRPTCFASSLPGITTVSTTSSLRFGQPSGLFSSSSNQQKTTTVSSTTFGRSFVQPISKARLNSTSNQPGITTVSTTSSSLFSPPTGLFSSSLNQQVTSTVVPTFGQPTTKSDFGSALNPRASSFSIPASHLSAAKDINIFDNASQPANIFSAPKTTGI